MNKLSIILEKCTGCKRCEQACAAAHSGASSFVGAYVAGTMAPTSIYVEPVGERAVPVVCRHCTEPMCVSACMAGCMQKDPVSGIVNNRGHEQQCVGCWMCVMACPFGVIGPSSGGASIGTEVFETAVKCDFCPDRDTPACVAACPDRAIEVITKDK